MVDIIPTLPSAVGEGEGSSKSPVATIYQDDDNLTVVVAGVDYILPHNREAAGLLTELITRVTGGYPCGAAVEPMLTACPNTVSIAFPMSNFCDEHRYLEAATCYC